MQRSQIVGEQQRSTCASNIPTRTIYLAILTLLPCLHHRHLPAEEITVSPPQPFHAIELIAEKTTSWRQGNSQVVHLVGSVVIRQHDFSAEADEAIAFQQPASDASSIQKLIVYLEGQPATVTRGYSDPESGAAAGQSSVQDDQLLQRLYTSEPLRLDAEPRPTADVQSLPDIFARALDYADFVSDAEVDPVAFNQENAEVQTVIDPRTGQTRQITAGQTPRVPDFSQFSLQNQPLPADVSSQPSTGDSAEQATADAINRPNQSRGTKVIITGRDPAVAFNPKLISNPNNPAERIWIGAGGVRVLIDSPEVRRLEAFRSEADRQIVVLADNVVAWQSPLPDGSDRWEMYLEGNVIFAKDRRTVYASQMYYDVNLQQGTILNADVFTPVQDFEGLVRLKADVIQQVDANNLIAHGAAFTTSRLAFPRYWLQSESIELTRQEELIPLSQFDSSGSQTLPAGAAVDDQYIVTSNRNRVYLGNTPVFAWPRYRTNLEDPTLYLKRIRIGNDNVFGFQLLTTWDLYQLFGVRNRAEGTELLGSLDYLSDRGLAYGTEVNYARNTFLGFDGPARGVYKSWFINDDGFDNLGRDRFMLTPEEEFRGRIFWRHLQRLPNGISARAEIGYLTDRNFLESFYEREWDTQKDATTGLWLERNTANQSVNLITDIQVNDFFTQTAWLPRFEHFVLGQPLFGNWPIIRHARSSIGYGRMRVADAPLDPLELFDPLAWEADVDGIRAGTRQELDFPRQFGHLKVVPYVLGDVTYWQEDLAGADAFRALGQVGVRTSLPFWKIDPSIQSTLWNVNGLAHKISFDMDAFYADASQDLGRFALYDNLDDDAQEAFRRRFAFNTFGILPGDNVPLMYDERFFALRSGLQSDVTANSLEIADDLSVLRFGLRQRWQTKRGLAGNERIIDWITFDVATSLFPEAGRDNFGADFGVFDYDFKWFIGDRLSLVSDAYLDFFSQGLRTVSVGLQSNRPGVGDVYLGVRSIEGPISANILSTAATYRMSDKWGLRANSQIDFGQTGSIGNALSLIYLGESFLWQFGVNADFSRSNVGFRFGFEPRFTNRPRLFRPGGDPLPPASANWLE